MVGRKTCLVDGSPESVAADVTHIRASACLLRLAGKDNKGGARDGRRSASVRVGAAALVCHRSPWERDAFDSIKTVLCFP